MMKGSQPEFTEEILDRINREVREERQTRTSDRSKVCQAMEPVVAWPMFGPSTRIVFRDTEYG